MGDSRPKAPDGLGERGSAFWESVAADYALRPDELLLLEDACREADMIARLEREVTEASLIVAGSNKQPVANPLVQELRQHRSVFARLVGQLRLPDEPGAPKKDASARARDAANARWAVQRGA